MPRGIGRPLFNIDDRYGKRLVQRNIPSGRPLNADAECGIDVRKLEGN